MVEQWRAGPYADPVSGRSCRSCHPSGRLPEDCRDGHASTAGASGTAWVRPAALLHARAWFEGGSLVVDAVVCNNGAGHHLPGGSADVAVLLRVVCRNELGADLVQLSGPRLRSAGSKGGFTAGCLFFSAASPDEQTARDTVGPIPPFGTRVVRFGFAAAAAERPTVRVVLVRRATGSPTSGETVIARRVVRPEVH